MKVGWNETSFFTFSSDINPQINQQPDRIRTGSRHSGLAGSHVRESRVTDKDLEKLVHLSLTESETITLLDLPSVVVSNDYAEEVEKVKIANEKYKKVMGNFTFHFSLFT